MIISPWMMGSALALGAAHALEPGHGKTLISAHLTSSRSKWMEALTIAALITALHAASVFVYGAAGVWLAQAFFKSEAVFFQATSVMTGIIILLLGSWWTWRAWQPCKCHHHAHENTVEALSTGFPHLFWVSLASSLSPCPTAIIVVSAMLSLGGTANLMDACLFLLLFSFGLSSTLLSFSMLMSMPIGRVLRYLKPSKQNGVTGSSQHHWEWPMVLRRTSAILMLVLGSFLTVKAVYFPDLGSLSELPWTGWLQSSSHSP